MRDAGQAFSNADVVGAGSIESPAAFGVPVVAFRERPDEWLAGAQQKISDLATLKPNWDSYGALRVSDEAIRCAMSVVTELSKVVSVPEPTIGASPDGEVGFCWDAGNWSLDLTIDAGGVLAYVYLDEKDPMNNREERTRSVQSLLPLLTRW
jgi:hypothetical protein